MTRSRPCRRGGSGPEVKLFVVRYRCGWEYSLPLLPGQSAHTVSPQVRRAIRKRHRLDCETCGLTPSARLRPSSQSDTAHSDPD